MSRSACVKDVARVIYEANPCGDQETDLDGRPTGPGYIISWDDLPEYDAGIYASVLETAAKVLACPALQDLEDDRDDYRERLRDLVMIDAEEWAIGGGPGFKDRHAKAWARAREIFEP